MFEELKEVRFNEYVDNMKKILEKVRHTGARSYRLSEEFRL